MVVNVWGKKNHFFSENKDMDIEFVNGNFIEEKKTDFIESILSECFSLHNEKINLLKRQDVISDTLNYCVVKILKNCNFSSFFSSSTEHEISIKDFFDNLAFFLPTLEPDRLAFVIVLLNNRKEEKEVLKKKLRVANTLLMKEKESFNCLLKTCQQKEDILMQPTFQSFSNVHILATSPSKSPSPLFNPPKTSSEPDPLIWMLLLRYCCIRGLEMISTFEEKIDSSLET
jgi:hypothetical protein